MSDYYIKHIWGPGGQEGYPHRNKAGEERIDFAEGQEKAAQRFSECKGFLLYETGKKGDNNKVGAMKIYAQGTVVSPKVQSVAITHGDEVKRFSYTVKTKLNRRIDPRDGVPLKTMKKILGIDSIQRPGGLLAITKEQFDALVTKLVFSKALY